MSLTDKIAEKIAGALGWLLLKELRRIATALEKGIDSERDMRGFRPLFAAEKSPIDVQIAEEQLDASGGGLIDDANEPLVQDGGDYMRLEILEMLARENRIHVDSTTDLVALGKERGWLDTAGEIVMFPQNYGQ